MFGIHFLAHLDRDASKEEEEEPRALEEDLSHALLEIVLFTTRIFVYFI
jgi:hypothetical protein